jgi:hypothetical protein
MAALCDRLGLEPGAHLDAVAAEFRPVPERPLPEDAVPAARLAEARRLYDELTLPT